MAKLDRLLITGAAGNLGTMARKKLPSLASILRVSDLSDLGDAAPNEELVPCDLGDRDAVRELVQGCDGIVHFGGVSTEDTFDRIRTANIDGVYNLYEAARAHGRPRIVFASSNHTIGFYRQDQHLTPDMPVRPDSLYGVSKCFGEALASMYFDKFGQETAIVRIGSCFPEPKDHRMLATWMSESDFCALIARIFNAPRIGCPIIWGVSDNERCWWDNSASLFLGWRPKENAECYARMLDERLAKPGPTDSRALFQGGSFCDEPIHGTEP